MLVPTYNTSVFTKISGYHLAVGVNIKSTMCLIPMREAYIKHYCDVVYLRSRRARETCPFEDEITRKLISYPETSGFESHWKVCAHVLKTDMHVLGPPKIRILDIKYDRVAKEEGVNPSNYFFIRIEFHGYGIRI